MWRTFALFAKLVFLAVLGISLVGNNIVVYAAPQQSPTATTSEIPSDPDGFWHAFRRAYPLHIQGIALSQPLNNKRTIIIAEPPPHVSLAQLQSLLPGAHIQQKVIGYDGWVR